MKITEIRGIGNYYGSLWIMAHKGKFYWFISCYDTDLEDLDSWVEISQDLYDKLYTEKRVK